ncbi:hypothetical protein L1787_17885 [Acuticoccus sp. M5D2P5]|uniref:hypothetical protein n=1 Tax=Acuticoccus kalidii TaxID=2910977 RepID=UPI001F39144F|nr:hypothetical protein [Acuticoccus kalidii]MCF3935274.1 hypothetical protein [Acuticoccus kalidii]
MPISPITPALATAMSLSKQIAERQARLARVLAPPSITPVAASIYAMASEMETSSRRLAAMSKVNVRLAAMMKIDVTPIAATIAKLTNPPSKDL